MTDYLVSGSLPNISFWETWNRRSEATALLLCQAPLSQTCLLSSNYFKEVHPNLSTPIHVGQSAGLCVPANRTHQRQDYQRERRARGGGAGDELYGYREILPVADSDGANSRTKDRQAGGQHGSLSICLLVRRCLSYLTPALCASHWFLSNLLSVCLSLFFFFLVRTFAVVKESSNGYNIACNWKILEYFN